MVVGWEGGGISRGEILTGRCLVREGSVDAMMGDPCGRYEMGFSKWRLRWKVMFQS